VNSGTLDTVTAAADIDLMSSGNNSLTVKNGLPLTGTLSLGAADGSSSGVVNFGDGSATPPVGPSGNATILFGGSGNNAVNNQSTGVGAAGAMTLPSTVVIHGKTGQINSAFSTASIVSQAPITADVAGGTITFNGAADIIYVTYRIKQLPAVLPAVQVIDHLVAVFEPDEL